MGLRSGEFTVKDTFKSSMHLQRRDVQFSFDPLTKKEVLSLQLHSSKTDPFRQGCTLLAYATGMDICAVSAMKKWLHGFGDKGQHAPLFTLRDGTPLSRGGYVRLLHKALDHAGLPSASYNGHSLRKGFATSAAAAGLPDHLISTLGRWSSSCYKLYISTPKAVISAAHQSICTPDLCNKL